MKILPTAAGLVLALDQASKLAILHFVDLDRIGYLDLLPVLTLKMVWNTGINFGLFAGSGPGPRIATVLLALAVSAAIAQATRRGPRMDRLLGGAVIGGALGNALDRAVHGAVVDFLSPSCCGIANPYAFNIADIAIVGGMAALLALRLRDPGRTPRGMPMSPRSAFPQPSRPPHIEITRPAARR